MFGLILIAIGIVIIVGTWMNWFGYYGTVVKVVATLVGVGMMWYGYRTEYPPAVMAPTMGGRRRLW